MENSVINELLKEEDEKAVRSVMAILKKHHESISPIPFSSLSEEYEDIKTDIRAYLTEPYNEQ
jgi:hypothetical protein